MRYKITFEYDGTNYCGFQKQPDLPNKSVEEIIENAVFNFAQQRVKIIASGRTDAGVHALAQVAHFDLNKQFPAEKIVSGLNNYLRGEDIAVLDCTVVDDDFHARFNAKMRHYRYLIINRRAPLTLQKNRAWHLAQNLDTSAMEKAAQFLVGQHDFSAFRDADCQAQSAIKTIDKIILQKNDTEILIEISATSFLHHMVRNIVGTLMWVGIDKIKAEEIKTILAAKQRSKSGPNAPSCGLYFLRVDY